MDTFHLQYMYTVLQKRTNVQVIGSNLVLCSSLSAVDLSLCAVMEINETPVARRFLNATWKVIIYSFFKP